MKLYKLIISFIVTISPLCAGAQGFIYINYNNIEQATPPVKSFQYVTGVVLKPGFSVSGSSGGWYARHTDVVTNAPQSNDKNYVRTETILETGYTS